MIPCMPPTRRSGTIRLPHWHLAVSGVRAALEARSDKLPGLLAFRTCEHSDSGRLRAGRSQRAQKRLRGKQHRDMILEGWKVSWMSAQRAAMDRVGFPEEQSNGMEGCMDGWTDNLS